MSFGIGFENEYPDEKFNYGNYYSKNKPVRHPKG